MIICPTPQLALAAMLENKKFFSQFGGFTDGDKVQLIPESAGSPPV
jgi:hypothetical protein